MIKNTHSIILSTSELTSHVKQLLNSPLWYGRVYFINGSVMRDSDLERAKFVFFFFFKCKILNFCQQKSS